MNTYTTIATLRAENAKLTAELALADQRAGTAERKAFTANEAMEAQRQRLKALDSFVPRINSLAAKTLNPLAIKACPFCGSAPEGTFSGYFRLSAINCSNRECVAHCRQVSVEGWNSRFIEGTNRMEHTPTFEISAKIIQAFYAHSQNAEGLPEHMESGIRAVLKLSPIYFFNVWATKSFPSQSLEKFDLIAKLQPSGTVDKLEEGLIAFAKSLPSVEG